MQKIFWWDGGVGGAEELEGREKGRSEKTARRQEVRECRELPLVATERRSLEARALSRRAHRSLARGYLQFRKASLWGTAALT